MNSVGLTIVANVAIATGLVLLWAICTDPVLLGAIKIFSLLYTRVYSRI